MTTSSRPDQVVGPLTVMRFVLDPRVRAEPYAYYRALREQQPVHHSAMAVTLLTRYDDVQALLTNPAVESNERHANDSLGAGRDGGGLLSEAPGRLLFRLERLTNRGGPNGRAFAKMANRFLILMDPPDHTRLRSLASRAFTPRVAEQARPMIETIAHDLLDRHEQAGRMDLIEAYAYQLPVIVICRLLGVPESDFPRFHKWVNDLVVGLDVISVLSPRAARRANDATVALDTYFRDLIASRRREPGDDLLSSLVSASDDGDRLSEEELVAFAVLLLAAGHETTANLLGNGMWHLFANQDQLDALRTDADLGPNAVNELLRYDSPIQLVQRIATTDIEIGGEEVAAGRRVVGLLGAANRDPERFDAPDELRLHRENCQPMSFGFGIHHCLGAALARVEAEVGLRVLLDRHPNLRCELIQPRWKPTMIFRGLRELPVAWG